MLLMGSLWFRNDCILKDIDLKYLENVHLLPSIRHFLSYKCPLYNAELAVWKTTNTLCAGFWRNRVNWLHQFLFHKEFTNKIEDKSNISAWRCPWRLTWKLQLIQNVTWLYRLPDGSWMLTKVLIIISLTKDLNISRTIFS